MKALTMVPASTTSILPEPYTSPLSGLWNVAECQAH